MLLVSRAMVGEGGERERELLHISKEDWGGKELNLVQLYLYGLPGMVFLPRQINSWQMLVERGPLMTER